MIECNYSKDEKWAYQTLKTTIQASKQEVFKQLATTEGIASWFPQLSIAHSSGKQSVRFDLGDGIFEQMRLLDFKTNEFIAFEWASGQVAFQLDEAADGTILTLKEALPLDFPALLEDFTGWFVQMKNIRRVLETGAAGPVPKEEIKKIKNEIKAQLGV